MPIKTPHAMSHGTYNRNYGGFKQQFQEIATKFLNATDELLVGVTGTWSFAYFELIGHILWEI
jgi:hypothetical protein